MNQRILVQQIGLLLGSSEAVGGPCGHVDVRC